LCLTHQGLQNLQSLRLLFHMVGSRLTLLRPKVMATLRLLRENSPTLQTDRLKGYSDTEESVDDIWEVFLKHLEVEHLGPILCEVFADLLPHFSSDSTGNYIFSNFLSA
jgi:hypothetical protein